MLTDFLQETFSNFAVHNIAWSHGIKEDLSGGTCSEMMSQALELVVDETTTRIRTVPGYEKRLRAPVAAAFRYIDSLVEQIPGTASCRRTDFQNDPALNAFFVNYHHLTEVFSQSKEVRELFTQHNEVEECYALICMHQQERQQLGMEINGDTVRKDVMQTAISFVNHQVLSPGISEENARCALKCCIFKGLLAYIRSITSRAKSQTSELTNHRSALQHRLRHLPQTNSSAPEVIALQQEIASYDKQIDALEWPIHTLEDQLNVVIKILGNPDFYLTSQSERLRLDRMGIQQKSVLDEVDDRGFDVPVSKIQIGSEPPRVARLVRFPRAELLPERDFLQEAGMFMHA